MTEEEFVEMYADRLDVKPEELSGRYALVAVPCDCNDAFCYGWVIRDAVTRNEHKAEEEGLEGWGEYRQV